MKNNDNIKINEEEKIKREAMLEYMNSSKELYKERKKKFIIFSFIAIVVILIIKIFFGTIELYNIFGYSPSNARYYKITVNDKQVSASYNLVRRIPIIPFLIYFNSTYLGNSYAGNSNIEPFFYADNSEHYYVDIKSYKCYYNNIQLECKNNDQTMKENNDEKFSSMKITRITNPYEVVYEGDVLKDISPYIKDEGQYHIEFTSKYGLIKSKIYFYFNNFKKES